MSKFVVIIFPSETAAYEGTRALNQLHAEGTVTLYGTTVLVRDANGNLATRQAVDQGPLGFAVGTLMGGLIGLIGGPVGGAIGMGAGAISGGLGDIVDLGIRSDFIEAVSTKLLPGKAAVAAEIEEDWITPLDNRMAALGGEVIRQWRSDFEAEQLDALAKERKAELAELKMEFGRASGDAKENLSKRLDETRAKVEATFNRAEAKQRQFEQEADAKLAELKRQIDQANAETKARIEKRLTAMKADFDRRRELLKEAWSLTRDALAA
ncbi:MAG: DUF1269 domain-containing protein [Bradyrhizobium sp.]|uniref:DUF1269 domain-containing protein n=1 Tax=Bradyrhizobium sp. TaxID=376 RepID=UPI0025BDFF55|nr:DUF1269 domain-containing protein [Bradyrhizobium sp.]MBI5264024.1 DUF1269 domain-containing protein [Bradyrhizobium sp.]